MATYTNNYNLPLYEESDIPNLLDEYNQAVTSIDAHLKTNADAVALVNTGLSQRAPIDHASTGTTYGVGSSTEYGHVKLYNSAGAQTDGAITPNAAQAAITAALSGYATDSDLTQQIGTRAPTNHATTGTTYGVGSSTNYGHVKLYNAVNSVSDGAVTPQAVLSYISDGIDNWVQATFSAYLPGDSGQALQGTAYYNPFLHLIKFAFKVNGTISANLPAGTTIAQVPSDIPRPASNRTLSYYGVMAISAPAGQFTTTYSGGRNLTYTTSGQLQLTDNESIIGGQSTAWYELTTTQALLYCGNWGGGF